MNDEETTAEPIEEPPVSPELAAAYWSKCYAEDEAFRAAFDKDPRAAISELVGAPMPANIQLVIHRKKYNELHVVVPAETGPADGVPEGQLEGVNAGVRIGFGFKPEGGRYQPVYDGKGRPW